MYSFSRSTVALMSSDRELNSTVSRTFTFSFKSPEVMTASDLFTAASLFSTTVFISRRMTRYSTTNTAVITSSVETKNMEIDSIASFTGYTLT